ncbi:hypothetical protein PHPALM_30757 [Phytophthora palmivora]|uniref:Tc1-like transposase DDE domain-containing protein n=1 Tax=Phytophthora palmivora TaxID=4796 RepID=A0A2P4X4D0_9STRA|nr:hypothetical protein PHPALM_30757 [Phytophthora palmivora]
MTTITGISTRNNLKSGFQNSVRRWRKNMVLVTSIWLEPPTTRTKQIRLQLHGPLDLNFVLIIVSSDIWFEENYTKAELLELVRSNKPKPKYQATHIATSHGHLVYFTPPYHPELQPIELICAHVKNEVANDPASSMQELRLKIDAAFDTIKSDQCILTHSKG